MANALDAVSVSKAFGNTTALDGVDLGLVAGEVHAVVGENGSGKSTLLQLLAGVYRPNGGELRVDGKPAEFHRPRDATHAGIVLVSQEGSIAPNLSVAENVFLGRKVRRPLLVDWSTIRRHSRALLRQLDVDLDPTMPAGMLPPDQRQLLEIARALSYNARIVLLDEPTSSLDTHEVDVLLRVVRGLADRGIAVGFVSHRLPELLAISDRFTVLRDGAVVGTRPAAEVDEGWLVKAMVGRELRALAPPPPPSTRSYALEVREIHDAHGRLRDVSLEVAPGEIVGLAGLVGAGRTELLETIAGLRRRASGSVRVNGTHVANGVRSALLHGLVLLADDRQAKSLLPNLSVHDNAALTQPLVGRHRFWRQRRAEVKSVGPWLEKLEVRCSSLAQPISALSGGNQQKVVLARALSVGPKIVLLDEPTRGIDLGAKQRIYEAIVDLAGSGLAVLIASSELPELLALCHRIVVMREGQVVADLPRQAVSEEIVVGLATGAGNGVAA